MILQNDTEWQLRQDLASAYNLAALFGWTDLIYTHISVRVPNEENTFLINPFGLMFHEITPENIIKIDFDGNIKSDTPYGVNSAGLIVHSAIHAARPDVEAICHFHTTNGMALSSLKDGLLPLTQHACHFYEKIAYHDFHGIILEDDEKELLISSIEHANILILRNHGFLTAGASIAEAFSRMYTLEKAAAAQLKAMATGAELVAVDNNIGHKVATQTGSMGIKVADIEWQALLRLLETSKNTLHQAAVHNMIPRVA
jgi:ribulose-5-phosphate 4-epimerase/fuculose-1-phosphate aldolase